MKTINLIKELENMRDNTNSDIVRQNCIDAIKRLKKAHRDLIKQAKESNEKIERLVNEMLNIK